MKHFIMSLTRISIGFMFLWAFFDKLFGLGFATPRGGAWIHGGSPTYGFLAHATKGPFAFFFSSLAGNHVIDWVFMIGLCAVGISLMFNYLTRLGAIAGMLMLALMYLAVLPPANNPVLDEHIIYILLLALIASNARALPMKA